MTIETKFNIGDKIFTLLCNEPTWCVVEGVNYFLSRNTDRITYYVVPSDGSTYGFIVDEFEVFRTKQELLDSL